MLDDERLSERLVDGTDYPVPCMPFTQLGRIPFRELLAARRISNFFDRDRALKIGAGVTEEMTLRAASLLRLPDTVD